MTRLEFAQQVLGYDPEITPQRELEAARWSLREADMQHRLDQRALEGLDDQAVYEWWLNTESQAYSAEKREVPQMPGRCRSGCKRQFTRANVADYELAADDPGGDEQSLITSRGRSS